MGVVRPPWISKRWFAQCPFNYCDHFGDKLKLAKICKICKDELVRLEHYKRAKQDPYDMKNVMKDVADDLAYTMVLVHKQAKRWGIDLDNLEDVKIEEPPPETYPIYNTIVKYGKKIEKFLKDFWEVPVETDLELIKTAVDVFGHSRYYIIAKTVRALSSRLEEEKDPEDDLEDSKTSAFLAYLAVERNSRAFLALTEHKPLSLQKRKFLNLAKISLVICELIRKEFFPNEKLDYEEFGYDYFKDNEKVNRLID